MTTSALAATLIHVDARPVAWLIGDRVWPYVAGGAAGDDGDGAAGGDAGASDGAAGSDAGADSGGADEKGKGDGETKKVDLTQAQLDEIVAKAKAKERKAAESDAKAAADREKLSETERLTAEKADADKRATEATEKANARLVAADVKVAAVEAGVKSDRVAAFLRIADLSEIAVDDDGEVDAKAVKKVVDATLKEFPEFKGTSSNGAGRGGGQHNGDAPPAKPTSLEEAVSAAYA